MAADDLVVSLRALTETLVNERTLGVALAEIAEAATRSVPGCVAASVAMSIEGRPATAAISGRVALELDLAQYDGGGGPCVESLRTSHVLRIDVVELDESLPHFASESQRFGIASVLSVPALWGDMAVGTLNLYSSEPGVFDESAETIGHLLAAQIAVAISRSQAYAAARNVAEQAQRDADDYAEIGLAKGLVMGNVDCTAEQAEGILQNAADADERTVVEIAQRIIREAQEGRHRG